MARVQRVITNETCNQNCWFCDARRPVEDRDFVAKAALHERIARACEGDTREIVLTGGEPTLRSDIAEVVALSGRSGARVVLETNAAVVDSERARQLAAAGLGIARVQLVAWGPKADEITRDPGGFEAAIRGIRSLAEAGVTVEVTTPIVARNVDDVGVVPSEIVRAGLPVAAMVIVIPTDAPDRSECATLPEIAAAATTIADSARRVGLSVRFDPSTFVPPCIFERPERVAHLFALNRGNATRNGYSRVAECEPCLVADRCPGLPATVAAVSSTHELRPVSEHRLRRRLTVVSTVEDQIARELVGHDELRHSAYGHISEYTVRVNFHCNQQCEFCFVSTHLPPPQEAAVREAIEKAGREEAVLVLSGGEPTLNANLLEYVRLAKTSGVRAVELQTNAIRLADTVLTQSLVEAGIEQAMVSLHGSTAEISDEITGAPGTFASTVLGLDELSKTSARLRLNFVFCQSNWRDFPRFIELVISRWPRAAIVFSFVGSHTDVVPRTTSLIPRFSDILPSLMEGLGRATEAGLIVEGFDSMCGLPLCLVPDAERAKFTEIAVAEDGGGGEFVKGDACAGCAEGYRCYGVRRGYAELYGTDELRALAAGDLSPAAS